MQTTSGLRLDGVRVLVVDDQEDARYIVATVLEREGATVTLAESAREALTDYSVSVPIFS